jgi:predicted transposase/invertase (TIGR01784 family)
MSAPLVTTADLLDPKNDYVFFRVFSEEPERLSAWIAYFEHWREGSTMSNPYPPVQRALEKLRELSADEEARYWAEARAKALSDEASLLSDAREEGREEASRNTAQNLIGLGVLTDVQIAQATGLTVAQVEALRTSQTD